MMNSCHSLATFNLGFKYMKLFFLTAFLSTTAILASSISTPALANSFQCTDITVANCPTTFREKCETDDAFFKSEPRTCVDAIRGKSVDKPFCNSPEAKERCEPAKDCSEVDDPTKKFFCEQGQSRCNTSIKGLIGEYGEVLIGLNTTLANYDQLTTLDLKDATSIELLCKFKLNELGALETQAKDELVGLQSTERSIGSLDSCSATMQNFLDKGAPEGLPPELWDQIIGRLTDGMKEINSQQGKIQRNIEDLQNAPSKLRALRTAYGLVCE